VHCALFETAKPYAKISAESGAGFLRDSVWEKPVSKFTVSNDQDY
jgi:hypothetical protein